MRRTRILSTAVVAMAVALISPAAAAGSAPVKSGGRAGGAAIPAATSESITCTMSVHTPHDSGHVGGTVNVTGDITCRNEAGTKTNVSSLKISLQLYKQVCDPSCSWTPYGSPGNAHNAGKYVVSTNSAGPCTPGKYEGSGTGSIVFPPGFEPPTGTVGKTGPSASVDCK